MGRSRPTAATGRASHAVQPAAAGRDRRPRARRVGPALAAAPAASAGPGLFSARVDWRAVCSPCCTCCAGDRAVRSARVLPIAARSVLAHTGSRRAARAAVLALRTRHAASEREPRPRQARGPACSGPFRDTKGEHAGRRPSARPRLRPHHRTIMSCRTPTAHAADLALLEPDPGAWIEFMLGDVPDLRARAGWSTSPSDFPLRLAEPSRRHLLRDPREQRGSTGSTSTSASWWTAARISLIPALLDFIADAGLTVNPARMPTTHRCPVLLPLPDGRLLAVPLRQSAARSWPRCWSCSPAPRSTSRPARSACPGAMRPTLPCLRRPAATLASSGMAARPSGRWGGSCASMAASRPALPRAASARRCGPTRRRAWPGCSSCAGRAGRRAGRRHGAGQDRAGAWPISRSSRPRAGSTALRSWSARPAWCRTGEPRRPASRRLCSVLVLHGPDRGGPLRRDRRA